MKFFQNKKHLFLFGAGLVAILIACMFDYVKLNYLAILTVRSLIAQRPIDDSVIYWGQALPDNCRAQWLLGHLYNRTGQMAERDQSWTIALQCDHIIGKYLHRLYPDDLHLANLALQVAPSNPEAWFWVGDLQPEKQIEYYQYGLSLDAADGRRWLTLGGLLREIEPRSAMEAYLKACLNGDPGANGCLGAGDIAENLGDYDMAIKYYRQSRLGTCQQRADELEQQLAHPIEP